MNNSLFLELLNISIGRASSFREVPTNEEWEELLNEAIKQSLIGITFLGMDSLDRQRPPLSTYFRWAYYAEKIGESNASHLSDARALSSMLREKGVAHCILKGQGTAHLYYPRPEMRQSGDIDVWVDCSRDEALSEFSDICGVGAICYHHFDIQLFKTTPVEVHIHPSYMNNPFANRRLQKWFDCRKEVCCSNMNEELGFPVPDAMFSTVYGVVHIFRHLFTEGIGLRQVMDLYYNLLHTGADQRKEVSSFIGKLGLTRFTSALMYVEQKVFGLEDEFLLASPDRGLGEYLFNEIFIAGNFGKGDARNAHSNSETLLQRAWRKLGRLAHLYRFSFSEVMWAPFYKTWQHILYKKFIQPKYISK